MRRALPLAMLAAVAPAQGRLAGPYAVVVSDATAKAWPGSVAALVAKYGARVVPWKATVREVLPALQEVQPRYVAFLARPEESDRAFVIAVHRLARRIDDDPYGDCLWGILTGHAEADVLRMVGRTEPLSVRRGAGGTGVPLDLFHEGIWWNECKAGEWQDKQPGGKAVTHAGAHDTTAAVAAELNGACDWFLTSGHARPSEWMIGFSFANGQLRCRDGQLFGVDLQGHQHDVQARGPRIYSAAGNCLMGRIVDRHSMALGWLHSGGVDQMTGYVVSTWAGHGGWSVNDYFYLGVHDFAESFFVANQWLVHELESRYPKTARVEFDRWDIEQDEGLVGELARQHGIGSQDEAGLLWDRDTVAFYGDPAWSARLDRQVPLSFMQRLVEANGEYTFVVETTVAGEWQRCPASLLPRRLAGVRVVEGNGVVTDDFVLLPLRGRFAAGERHAIRFGGNPR